MFSNKIIVITGGTGSFGQAFLQRMLKTNIKEIRIFSRDEKKQEDLRIVLNNARVRFYIGDVRDLSSIEDATKGANYLFHAAALKQVPSCEFYPMQAVQTNILGADNVLKAAISNNLEKVILLSTDKAVYPINAMGLSKSMMEKIMIAKSRILEKTGTLLCATRYGNVMCSRGSVIPLFVEQILQNRPITITNPSMTRFLMSLEESVELVLYALANAQQGDIFVQKAPACTIKNLAIAIQEIFKSNVEIKYIGTRHGEKLYESLVSSEEMVRAEDLEKYYRIPCDSRTLNYSKYFNEGNVNLDEMQDYTSHNTSQLDIKEIKDLLLKLDFIKKVISHA